MATLKALRIRIGSVSSSEKITGAMKMISSAKVHKNEQELKRLLPFRNQIKSIMSDLIDSNVEFDSPLLDERDVNNICLVVYGTDDGLCGAYNINVFKNLLVEINTLKEQYKGASLHFTIMPVGKKIFNACKKLEMPGMDVYVPEGVDSKMSSDRVNDFTESLRGDFESKKYDLVKVVYMRYVSRSRQIPSIEGLFPVSKNIFEDIKGSDHGNNFYLFEPDPNSIFNEVLPMFVLSTMQEITIENRASEQAARVMAMQSANDNAKKLLESLQLEYNKLRQQAITTELLDILGGQIEK